ncbi:LysR family transcriptional regulator [Eoetvoesiella caeni]
MHAINDIDLNLMRVFRAIYEESSLTTVADQLGLSQPAISYSLARLRTLLDDPLFVRTRNGMQPTAAAQRLAQPIGQALDLLNDALQGHRKFDPATARRVFRLSMSDLGEMVFLPPLCEYLAQHAPGIRLEVDPVSMETLPEALRNGDIDLAIGNLASLKAYTRYVTLFHEEYACMLRADHPYAARSKLTLDNFLALSHVFVSSTSNAHHFFENALLEQGIHRNIALQVPHFTVVPDILQRSDMICSIPHRVARQFNRHKEFKIFPLPMPVPPSDVAVHWHDRFSPDGSNRWLRELVLELLQEEGVRPSARNRRSKY